MRNSEAFPYWTMHQNFADNPILCERSEELWNLWKEPTLIILSTRLSKTYLFIELSSSLHTLPIKNLSSWWNFFIFCLFIAFFNAFVSLQYLATLPLINTGFLRSAEKHLWTQNSSYKNVTWGVRFPFTEGFLQAYRPSIQPPCSLIFIDWFTATCFPDFRFRSISTWQHCPPTLTKDLVFINVIYSPPRT